MVRILEVGRIFVREKCFFIDIVFDLSAAVEEEMGEEVDYMRNVRAKLEMAEQGKDVSKFGKGDVIEYH